MTRKSSYLALATVGLIGPYYFFGSFLAAHGVDAKEFLREVSATNVSAFFALDLVLSSVVFVRYLRQEAGRCSIRHWWLYLIALLTVGLSLALPLFLYVRECRLESRARAASDEIVID